MTNFTRVRGRAAALVLALGVSVAVPHAQAQGGGRGEQTPAARAQLEQRFRERLAGVVQERLHLTAAQMAKLKQTNAKFEPQRRKLLQDERAVRLDIRREVMADSAANQPHVAELIQTAIRIQRQRLDLVDAEQKELAQFMTPVQRAKYLDLQEKLRQRVEQLRREHGGGPGGRRGAVGGARRPVTP